MMGLEENPPTTRALNEIVRGAASLTHLNPLNSSVSFPYF